MTHANNSFCERLVFHYEDHSYNLIGVGGQVQEYRAGVGGKLWTITILTKNGDKEFCKAYGAWAILSDSIGREALPSGSEIFPHVSNPKKEFAKMPDLLIGHSDLRLQPKYPNGITGKDYNLDCCCFESKFGSGLVVLGKLCGTEAPTIGRLMLCSILQSLSSSWKHVLPGRSLGSFSY